MAARIVRDPDVCFGAPRIEGHRITVGLIHELVDAGHSVDAIAEDLELTREEVQAAIDFFRGEQRASASR